MQGLGGITAAQLSAPVQSTQYKVEVWDGAAWQDLSNLGSKNYILDVSFDAGGPGPTPTPICGSWSATLSNQDGIFHPLNGASAYATLLQVGRKVRVSVGAIFAGSTTYWQRLLGYMDTPNFDVVNKQVTLRGFDYTKPLTDYQFGLPGNSWGTSATFSTVETTKTYGAGQYYALHDAIDTAAENNYVTGWSVLYATKASVTDGGAGSTYALELVKDTSHDYGWGAATMSALAQHSVYEASFWYSRMAGAGTLACYVYNHAGTSRVAITENLASDSWVQVKFHFTAIDAGTATLYFYIYDAVGNSSTFRVDQFSLKEVTARKNTRYPLPAACNAPYYIALNSAVVWHGQSDFPWDYDSANNVLYFDDAVWMAAGSSNLVVYYMTTQTLENVVADVLVRAGLYATEGAALSAMDYVATGVTVPLVWFDATTTGLAAIQAACERVNYRFWFGWDGTPHFRPAPVVAAPAFSFTSFGHIGGATDGQDLSVIANDIQIQGLEQGDFMSSAQKQTTALTSEVTDATSIAAYGQITMPITNRLFQDQASQDAMAATYLALYKTPKFYSSVTFPTNVVPLEIGDTITWVLQFNPGQNAIGVTGIVRSVSVDMGGATYNCEVAGTFPVLLGVAARAAVGTLSRA